MRILLSTISLDPERGGGTTARTRKLAKHLARAGAKVTVISIQDGAVAEELRSCGIETSATGFLRLRFTVPLLRPWTLWRLVRRSDALHILGYWNLLSVATAALARLMDKPYVLCAAGEFASIARPGLIARLFRQWLGRPLVRGAAKLISITELERQEIIELFGRAPEEVITIPNGVDDDAAVETADVPAFLPDGPFILFVGRLAPIKGPDILLEAFARCAQRFPEVTLAFAGPEFGLGDQLRQVASCPLLEERVLFLGFLDETRRTAAYRRAELLVVPSRSEAMSLVALEAGVEGLPVLVTDRCGLDVVAEVGGGEVCAATPSALSDALSRLLEAGDRRAKGARWRRYVTEHYRWPAIAERLLDLLKSLR